MHPPLLWATAFAVDDGTTAAFCFPIRTLPLKRFTRASIRLSC